MTTEDDKFNESLLTLLDGQQDLQGQSLNMVQDIMNMTIWFETYQYMKTG